MKTILPFLPEELGRERVSAHWCETKDGDPQALAIHARHYSARRYRDGRVRRLFVGPGEKLVLIGVDGQALLAFRKFRDASGQQGVNLSFFRNESAEQSSLLLREAMRLAWERWPGDRLYTFVDDRKTRAKRDPGYCFLVAGWELMRDGQGAPVRTKDRRLLILEAAWS